MNLLTLGIALFVLLQLWIGWWASKRIASESDYVVAGRKLGPWLCGFSIFATWFGAESVMGSSAAIAENGLSGGRADPMGYAVCLLLLGLLVAKKLRQSGAVTLADFLRMRFGKHAERIATIVIIPPSLLWGAAQIRAFAQVLSTQSDALSINAAIVLATALVIAYTYLGGLMGDVITDVVQGGIVLVGLLFLLFAVMMELGGPGAAFGRLEARQFSLVAPGESALARIDMWMVPVIGALIVQETASRVLGTRSDRVAVQGSLIGSATYLLFGILPVLIGLFGAHLGLELAHTEDFIPVAAETYLHGAIYVIFIAALVSIILSTSDSTLLAIGALAVHNLFYSWNRELSDQSRLRLTRRIVVLAGITCAVIAVGSDRIYDLVLMADGFGTAGIATVGLFGLWTRFGGGAAAIATFAVGMASSMLGRFVFELEAPFLTSLCLAVATFIAVGLIERGRKASSAGSSA